ncbi:MAG: hypothetical protein ACT4PP_15505 [Sporichthyaceae bacterium]
MFRYLIRVTLVLVLATAALPMMSADAAPTCMCRDSDELGNFERAGVVFKGTVETVTSSAIKERGKPTQLSGRYYTFTPTKTYKGETVDPQTVFTAGDNASCGVDLDGSGPYLVFANIPDREFARQYGLDRDGLTMSSCGGTRPIGADEEPNFNPLFDTSPGRAPDIVSDPGGFAEFYRGEVQTFVNNLQRIRPI